MGDEMKFPNEVWIYDYEGQRWQQKEDASQQRYIHESRVPISCGGTMEENDSNALARVVQEWKRGTVCDFSGEDTVLTPGSAEPTHRFVHPYNSHDTTCECGAEDSSKCAFTSGSADTQGQGWGGKP
jgi:hypothetical protein